MNFICEGLDRLGKDTLIDGILQKYGYHVVLHRSKPQILDFYELESLKIKHSPAFLYQRACFSSDMSLLKYSTLSNLKIIFNRSWIGEAVYSNMYRGYNGDYVFDLEKIAGVDTLNNTRLILLTEDFNNSNHFVDDGLSIDASQREVEQSMFIEAFHRSVIKDKRIICVTDSTGTFRNKTDILEDALR